MGTTEFKDISSLSAELMAARKLYQLIALRAASAWALVIELGNKQIWVPREAALDRLAHKTFFDPSCDAAEQFESESELRFEMAGEVDSTMSLVTLPGVGVCYLLKPFFPEADVPYGSALGLSYFSGCSREAIADLNVLIPIEVSPVEPTGLTKSEYSMLIDSYSASTLTLINKLRHLSTSMHYVTGRLSEGMRLGKSAVEMQADPGIADAVSRLVLACELPFGPSPATHFGTIADRINPLKTFPLPAQVMVGLLLGAKVAENTKNP